MWASPQKRSRYWRQAPARSVSAVLRLRYNGYRQLYAQALWGGGASVARMHIGMPNVQWPHAWLAAGYARLGQLEEAGAEAADVLRINPAFTIESWKRTAPFKDLEHLIDGLRKAGLPET